jgi:hypothetical protein
MNRVQSYHYQQTLHIRQASSAHDSVSLNERYTMSAYGNFTVAGFGPINPLPSTSWDLPQPAPFRRLVLHHLRLDSARAHPGLLEYTHHVFAAEIEAGRTYPQESAAATAVALPAAAANLSDGGDFEGTADAGMTHGYTRATFEAYFWAADVIVAVGMADAVAVAVAVADDGRRVRPVRLGGAGWGQAAAGEAGEDWDLDASRGGRSWEDALVGFYYVKPNYPGRSSHVSCCQKLRAPCLLPPVRDGGGAEVHRRRQALMEQRKDMQCRFFDPPCSSAVRVWNGSRQVVLALRSLAWIQSERLQSGICK